MAVGSNHAEANATDGFFADAPVLNVSTGPAAPVGNPWIMLPGNGVRLFWVAIAGW